MLLETYEEASKLTVLIDRDADDRYIKTMHEDGVNYTIAHNPNALAECFYVALDDVRVSANLRHKEAIELRSEMFWAVLSQQGLELDIDEKAIWSDSDKLVDVLFEEEYGYCKVTGLNHNGLQRILFSYFTDELSFTKNELIGLTAQQAIALHTRKDTRYLQS